MKYGIRWSRSDYSKLGQAIKNYNKVIENMSKNQAIVSYLPNILTYKEVKEGILTRKELNRIINSLKRIRDPVNQKIITLQNGRKILNWELKELNKARRRRIKSLENEILELEQPLEFGYSRAQMGSTEYRELQARIKNLRQFGKEQDENFYRTKRSILKQGSYDYDFKKAIIYRENYIAVMKKYSDFENYELLEELFKKLNNPIQFFEYMKNNELTVDLTLQSDQVLTQNMFNRYLEMLGLEVE